MPELQVKKKDGGVEPFMREKLSGSLVKSGATPDQAESITSQVESWVPSVAEEGVVPSSTIREKVSELLGAENPAAAENYSTFKKEVPAEAAVPAM